MHCICFHSKAQKELNICRERGRWSAKYHAIFVFVISEKNNKQSNNNSEKSKQYLVDVCRWICDYCKIMEKSSIVLHIFDVCACDDDDDNENDRIGFVSYENT